MTTPELKPALLADRTIVHVGQEPTAEGAYQKLLSETQQVTTGMTDTARSIYSRTLPQISPDQMRDLSIGYASANFKTLDANDNGQIDKEELKVRQALVEKKLPHKQLTAGLPAAMEAKLIESLVSRHSYLRTMAKTGSWWNLNQIDPKGLTKEDISAALKDVTAVRQRYPLTPLRADIKPDSDLSSLPAGVPELFNDAGVQVKTVNEPVRSALSEAAKDNPVISIAAAVYIPHTKEIFVQNDAFGKKAVLHETGHAIDDALVPGCKFFSESELYNQSVDLDIKNLSKTKVDWQKELPTVHLFIMSGLHTGSFNESARKELFAELYQSGDVAMADKLRQYFPHTGGLVDKTLKEQGLSRQAR